MSNARPSDAYNLCSFTFANGTRCAMPASPRSEHGLCYNHEQYSRRLQVDGPEENISHILHDDTADFLTQVDINTMLSNLLAALAANRVSARRASALAYIASLLMRSQQLARKESHDCWATLGDRRSMLTMKFALDDPRHPDYIEPEPRYIEPPSLVPFAAFAFLASGPLPPNEFDAPEPVLDLPALWAHISSPSVPAPPPESLPTQTVAPASAPSCEFAPPETISALPSEPAPLEDLPAPPPEFVLPKSIPAPQPSHHISASDSQNADAPPPSPESLAADIALIQQYRGDPASATVITVQAAYELYSAIHCSPGSNAKPPIEVPANVRSKCEAILLAYVENVCKKHYLRPDSRATRNTRRSRRRADTS